MSVASVKPRLAKLEPTAGEAGRQQKAKAVVDFGEQLGDHQHPKQGGQGKLDGLGQHFIGEVGAHPLHLRPELLFGEGKAVHTNRGKNQNDEYPGVVSDGVGEGEDIEPLGAQGQGNEAGDHTGGDKELLHQAHLGPDQLSQNDKQGCKGKIKQEIIDGHVGSSLVVR